MNKNLLYWFKSAKKHDITSGMQWYSNARLACVNMVKNTDIPIISACAVVSALSPFNKWERNIIDADNVIQAFICGHGPDSVSVGTFNANKEKAFRILKHDHTVLTSKSRKTFSFVHNIAYENSPFVTVDRHAMKAYYRKKIAGEERITNKLYDQVEKSYIDTAKSLDIKPYQLQAIVWTVYKRIMER